MGESVGGARAQQKQATQAKLITAARRSFGTVGYAETSMDDLCAAVGLTRGALYHSFGGKPGLLEAVVLQINGEIDDRLDHYIQGVADPWTAFRGCFQAYVRMALEPEIQQILFRDAPAVLGQRLREIDEDSALVPVTQSLQELMDAGIVIPGDAEALARLLNGASVDAALWVAVSAEPDVTLVKAEAALMQLIDGLRCAAD